MLNFFLFKMSLEPEPSDEGEMVTVENSERPIKLLHGI